MDYAACNILRNIAIACKIALSFTVNQGASLHKWTEIRYLIQAIANAEAGKHREILLYNCCSVIFSLASVCNYCTSSSFPWSLNSHDHLFYDRMKGNSYDQRMIYGHPMTSPFQPDPMNYYMSNIEPKGIHFVPSIIMPFLRILHIRNPYLLILDKCYIYKFYI